MRRDQHDALGAVVRSIFTADDGDQARRRLTEAIEQLERRLPKVAAMLEEAEIDVLAFDAFPAEHWPKLRSTDENVKCPRTASERVSGDGAVATVRRQGLRSPPSASVAEQTGAQSSRRSFCAVNYGRANAYSSPR